MAAGGEHGGGQSVGAGGAPGGGRDGDFALDDADLEPADPGREALGQSGVGRLERRDLRQLAQMTRGDDIVGHRDLAGDDTGS
ncbi:hypothetical protein ACGFOU_17800 [Streptomyces sp. NPDC048595]|uniref:hypothetical protein n=1 Tax=Streptomyces sp. NPDC048595 TaxID=3365576 RepID=UPI003718E74A